MPNRVLPEPAEPHRSVGRPCGRPPLVTSSRPRIPVAALPMVGNRPGFACALAAMKTSLNPHRRNQFRDLLEPASQKVRATLLLTEANCTDAAKFHRRFQIRRSMAEC